MSYRVTVFAYNFSHRKTRDILIGLNFFDIKNVLVIAAPKVNLKHNNSKQFTTLKNDQKDDHPRDLCKKFNFIYEVCAHDNFSEIKSYTTGVNSNIAIISGARIIQKNVIDLFRYGIINYHPGALPETSGLDSFYWMIKKNARPVASAHFINSKVDAGELIEEHPVHINSKDTIKIVQYNLYSAQLKLHQKICEKIVNNESFNTSTILRPLKNNLMQQEEKDLVLKSFDRWKKNYSVFK